MNKGDTVHLQLDYRINGDPLQNNAYDEIEFMLSGMRFSLSEGRIYWHDLEELYCIDLTQEETMRLLAESPYQIRIKIDGEVISSDISKLEVGKSLSRDIL